MKPLLRIASVAFLTLVALVDGLVVGAAFAIDRPLAPSAPSAQRVLEGSSPAVALVQTDLVIHTSYRDAAWKADAYDVLTRRLEDLARQGKLQYSHSAVMAAATQLIADDPGAFLGPDGAGDTTDVKVTASGTGFFYREDGYLITATHVVAPTTEELAQGIADGLGTDSARADARRHIASYLTGFGFRPNDAQLDKLVGWYLDYLKSTIKVTSVDTQIHVGIGSSVQAGERLITSGWRATVVAQDAILPKSDVAVLRVEVNRVPALALAGGDPVIGSTDYVVGYPRDKFFDQGTQRESDVKMTQTRGHVTHRKPMDGWSAFATDAGMTHGNSGGPVLDTQGRVIGIASFGDGGERYFVPASAFGTALSAAGAGSKPASGTLTPAYYQALAQQDARHYKTALVAFGQLSAAVPGEPYWKEDAASAQAAVLAGRDRTPFDFWHYLPAAGISAALAVLATLGLWVMLVLSRLQAAAPAPAPGEKPVPAPTPAG